MNNNSENLKLPSYGGQALIEGVLMRGANYIAAAIRLPDGSIHIEQEKLSGIYKSGIRKIPFLRGLILLWDAMVLGTKYLGIAANLQGSEEEKIDKKTLSLTIVISIALAVGLFFVLPALASQGLMRLIGFSAGLGNVIEGLVRLAFIIGYMWAIGLMPDIRRVFAYHGAEHKTINAFEAGAELTPENVAKYSLEHPRCGTAFLLTLIIFSIILFSLLGDLPFLLVIISRIIFVPILAMFAYEYIRFTANHLENPLIKLIIIPNLALQKLTTREPDLAMLEVSIAAFDSMYKMESEVAS